MPAKTKINQWSSATVVWRGRLAARRRSRLFERRLLLLERHAEVEAEDRLGRRPLHLAAQQGHTDVCVALVDSGEADVPRY